MTTAQDETSQQTCNQNKTKGWFYKDQPFMLSEDHSFVGFVYLITNLKTKQYYIGQKKFINKVKKKRKQKTNKTKYKTVRSTKESDWETYYGSSDELNNDVANLGEDNFHREILFLCDAKAQMNYIELREQMKYDVLFDPLSYNKYVGGRINRRQLKIG